MWLNRLEAGFLRGCLRLLLFFLLFSFFTRLGLTIISWHQVKESIGSLLLSWLIGIPFDLAAGFSLTLVWVTIFLFISPFFTETSVGKKFLAVMLGLYFFSLLFLVGSEFVFWNEFQTRLNFISIDYLIYPQEVVKNIQESYPLGWILSGMLFGSVVFLMPFWKCFVSDFSRISYFSERSAVFLFWVLMTMGLTWVLDNRMTHRFHNPFFQELGRNGLYSFVAAGWDQGLQYEGFYRSEAAEKRYAYLRQELGSANSRFLSEDPQNLWRQIENAGPEKKWNVVQITVESLSASYLGVFGNKDGLTPHLDRMASEGLFFTNLYATGSRTIRGMESLTLSLPPTPGQSILRRKGNHGLFTLGSLFHQRGYVSTFFYGGRGSFDNMNDYFSGMDFV